MQDAYDGVLSGRATSSVAFVSMGAMSPRRPCVAGIRPPPGPTADGNPVFPPGISSYVPAGSLYQILYEVSDRAGNRANITRAVRIVDSVKPQLTLIGGSALTLDYRRNPLDNP